MSAPVLRKDGLLDRLPSQPTNRLAAWRGLLKHRKAAVFSTTGGDEAGYAKMGFAEIITRPMADGTLRFCGIPEVISKVFSAVPGASDEARKAMLDEAREIARNF